MSDMDLGLTEVGRARVDKSYGIKVVSFLPVEKGLLIYASAVVGDATLGTCLVSSKPRTKIQLQLNMCQQTTSCLSCKI